MNYDEYLKAGELAEYVRFHCHRCDEEWEADVGYGETPKCPHCGSWRVSGWTREEIYNGETSVSN